MVLVLNGTGDEDKLCPLGHQPPTSEFKYNRFCSLNSDLLRNVSRLGLREPACNMEMRD